MIREVDQRLSRRAILAVGGLATASAVLPLAACSGKSSPASQASAATLAKVPSYIPYKGVEPDLPAKAGNMTGYAAYYNYPSNAPRSVQRTPVSGGTTSVMLTTFAPPPTPEAHNACWQEIERRLGCKLDLNLVASTGYSQKFAAVTAGNLPDMLDKTRNLTIPHLPEFLQAKCADLTPFLAGDAIKRWPNLANIPTVVWKNSALNGRIYGLPYPVPQLTGVTYYDKTRLDALGASLPKNAEDLLALLKEATQPKAGHYGFVGAAGTVMAMALCKSLWRLSPGWYVDSAGKFTKDYEKPGYKDALDFNRKLFKAGVFYPGSQGISSADMKNAFNSGNAFMVTDGLTAYASYWQDTTVDGANIQVLIPPGHDGGKGTMASNPGFFSITLMKKADSKRIEQLLGLGNFFAAPFGTEEYLLTHYGAPGTDYTRDKNGNPVATKKGAADLPGTTDSMWPGFVANCPWTIYNPASKAFVDSEHQATVAGLPLTQPDPTNGLYSATDASQGPTVGKTVDDGCADIVVGRRPISDFDKLVSDWKSQGGDQIRSEYQSAWNKSHG